MKKLMFMLGVAACAVGVQAATVSWTCTNVKDGSGNAISGVAYFVNAATLSQSDFKALSGATAMIDALKFDVDDGAGGTKKQAMYSFNPSPAGKYTEADGVANATLGLQDATASSAYLVIFDTATITDDSHYYLTDVKSFNTFSGTESQQVKWGSQSTASQAAGAWANVKTSGGGGTSGGDAPEPTSGLLLLVGGAMLALRRKQK